MTYSKHKFTQGMWRVREQPIAKPLHELLRRPYWTRLWVCQEFTLAQELIIFCGVDHCSKTELETAVRVNNTVKSDNDNDGHLIVGSQQGGEFHSLHEAIGRFANFGCEDPRDRIFGLASFITSDERPRVDYTASAFNVFAETVVLLCTIRPYQYPSFDNVDMRKGKIGRCVDNILAAVRKLVPLDAAEQLASDIEGYWEHIQSTEHVLERMDGPVPHLQQYLLPAGVERLKAQCLTHRDLRASARAYVQKHMGGEQPYDNQVTPAEKSLVEVEQQ